MDEEKSVRKRIPANAFDHFLSLGLSRSYQSVADWCGVSKQAVTRLAKEERWLERVAELERKARDKSEEKFVETLEAMNERHLKTLRVIQGKALEALKNFSLESAMEAVRALDLSIKHERIIKGEPSERTAVSVESIIRKEYERWMVVVDSKDTGDNNTKEENHV